jgi:Ser/Thr protein kinase RdoA (MazF antagonist)
MTEVFPAIYSTLSPQVLIERVLSNYDLGAITKCLLWNRGLSDIYLVQTYNTSYILKISHHHWRTKTEIQFELELLDFLHYHRLPVAYPISTSDGKLSVTIHALEGERYAALFPYAPGSVAIGDFTPTQSQILGSTLSKLHKTSLKLKTTIPRQPLNLQYLLQDSLETIRPYLQHRTEDCQYLQTAIANIEHKLSLLPQKAPYWSVCWGDPHSGNVHFTSDNQLTLFDFDQCGYGWRAFDLAKFLQVSLGAGIARNIRDAFFAGYQTIEPLSELEMNSLQALTQTAHIWSWAICINSTIIHNWSRLDDRFFTKRLERLKRLNSKDWQLF